MAKPTHEQNRLLQDLANGGKLWRARAKHGADEWHIRQHDRPNVADPVRATTAQACAAQRWIEPTGTLYWRLTVAGKVHTNAPPAENKLTQPKLF